MCVLIFVFYIVCLLTYSHIKIFAWAFLINTNNFVSSILSHLIDFAISVVANLLLQERLKIPEAYSKPSQTF